MRGLKMSFMAEYCLEHQTLSPDEIYELLERGKVWDVSPTLNAGGAVIFPHASIRHCGHQIAAAVHGCLKSGADQILALGVTHSVTERQSALSEKVRQGGNVFSEPERGVFPRVEGEFSLFHFKRLLQIEAKRRGVKPPRLIERYAFLACGEPESMPGIEELKRISSDSVVVATGDLVHHGVAYNTPYDQVLEGGPEGLLFARKSITKGLSFLGRGDYKAYLKHCLKDKSDFIDCGSVLGYVMGKFKASILDLKLVDSSYLFEDELSPSWVATALITIKS